MMILTPTQRFAEVGVLHSRGLTMTVYNQGRHRRIAEHVVDAFIGTAMGVVLVVLLWLFYLLFTLPR
jgi:hypothetical protein